MEREFRIRFCVICWEKRCHKTLRAPELATNTGDGIGKCRVFLDIPTGLTKRVRFTAILRMRQQCHQREERQQRWGGPGDSLLIPLPLGFHAEVGADCLESGLHLPTADEPGNDL